MWGNAHDQLISSFEDFVIETYVLWYKAKR